MSGKVAPEAGTAAVKWLAPDDPVLSRDGAAEL